MYLKKFGTSVFRCPWMVGGMNVRELEKTQAGIAYVAVSPVSNRYRYPIERRQELLKWVKAEESRYLIEDDYDSEFRYKGRPIPASRGMDDSQKVITWEPFHVPLRLRSELVSWSFQSLF